MPISAWVLHLGISFGHQVADDAKAGSGMTEKHESRLFWENWLGSLEFSHDFKGLEK